MLDLNKYKLSNNLDKYKIGVSNTSNLNKANQPNLLKKGADLVDNTLGKASNFLFGTTAKTAGTVITSGIGAGASLYGQATGNEKAKQFGENIQKNLQPITKTDIAFTALELYPGGGAVTKALRKLPGANRIAEAMATHLSKIPSFFRERAIKQYSEALGATTKELKAQTAKVVPKLLDKGVIASSLPRLENKASGLMDIAGEAVKTAENAIPETAMTKVKPFIDEVTKMRDKYIVGGKVFNQTAVDVIDKTAQTVAQYGSEISTRNLIKIKRLLDESVSLANKNFTKEEGLTILAQAQEGMANTMRAVLNEANPVLAKANKEFNLWSNVQKIVKATIERKSTQGGGLSRIILSGLGGVAGAESGQGWEQKLSRGVAGIFLGKKAIELFRSPAYKTLSAVNKNKLADYLASGKLKEAEFLIGKLATLVKNSISGK